MTGDQGARAPAAARHRIKKPLPWPQAMHGLPPAILRGLTARRRVDLLVLGNSHTGALLQSLDPQTDRGVEIVRTSTHPSPTYPPLNAPLLARYQPRVVVSMIGGNHHNALGLLELPEPFDVMTEDDPQTLPGRRVVPVHQIRAALSEHMAGALQRIDLVRRTFPGPMAHMTSPPPIADEDHIKTYPGAYAPPDGFNPKVAPSSVRLKLYRIQRDLLREACKARDITFLGAPADAVDAEGFLAEPYRRDDPTHANERYGRLALEAIKAFARTAGAGAPASRQPEPGDARTGATPTATAT